MSAETIPYRPRTVRGRMETGRLIRVYEGPPTVALFVSPYRAITDWVEDGLTNIFIYLHLGTLSRCRRCVTCKGRDYPDDGFGMCRVSIPTRPGDDVPEPDVESVLERVRQANL
jgi:hypothetical protein